MMKVLCWSGGAQDGADNADGTQPSPETPVVSRFRYRAPVGMEPAGNPGLSGCLTAFSTCCVVWASLARSRSMVRMTHARLRWRAVQRAAGRVARANAPRRKGRGKSRAAADPLFRGSVWRKFIVGDGGLALSDGPSDRLQAKISDALVHEKVDLEVRVEGRTAERDFPLNSSADEVRAVLVLPCYALDGRERTRRKRQRRAVGELLRTCHRQFSMSCVRNHQ
jgi:hypothetical protein